MKPITLRIGIALLAFSLGVVASTIRLRYFVSSPESTSVSLHDEEWHRLFEAAGMSGDSFTRELVYHRLLCANQAGVPDARRIEIDGAVWCQRDDGTIHQVIENDTSEYGSYFTHIRSSHGKWAVENIEFGRQVSTELLAKQYVANHAPWLYE